MPKIKRKELTAEIERLKAELADREAEWIRTAAADLGDFFRLIEAIGIDDEDLRRDPLDLIDLMIEHIGALKAVAGRVVPASPPPSPTEPEPIAAREPFRLNPSDIPMGHRIDFDRVTFQRNPADVGVNALAQLESHIRRLVEAESGRLAALDRENRGLWAMLVMKCVSARGEEKWVTDDDGVLESHDSEEEARDAIRQTRRFRVAFDQTVGA